MAGVDNQPSSSHVIAEELTKQVKTEDIYAMVAAQREMLMRYEKTNEMLLYFNILSKSCFDKTSQEMKIHTQMLTEMKSDLDSVFRRIRLLKGRLQKMHTEAFAACNVAYHVDDDETIHDLPNPDIHVELYDTSQPQSHEGDTVPSRDNISSVHDEQLDASVPNNGVHTVQDNAVTEKSRDVSKNDFPGV